VERRATGESSEPGSNRVLLGWGLIFVVTVGIFIGTLTLKPKKQVA
jgi:hypothetical protein